MGTIEQTLVHSSQDIDLPTYEQVLVHAGQDRDYQSVPLFGQRGEHIIVRYHLAPGVTFFHDVGFTIHTTRVVLLRVKVLDRVHIYHSTTVRGEYVHSSRCFLSTS